MQVSSSVSNRYYTPYQTNTSVKYCAGFSQKEDGKLTPNETTENPGFAEFVDYQEFHKAWMSQGAETAFSYTSNNGFNAEANSISLVPGISVRLSNGFRLAIGDYMVQALGDFKDNQAASESAAIAGALSHLIKVANGQIPMNMFYSKNQDNSAYAKIGLQAFGIDTSRPFTINEKTFHFDSDGQIRLGRGQYVSEEYETSIVSDETEVYTAKQTGAVSIAETEDEGEFLGLTMVPEEGQSVTYGMRAMLSEKSTPDNPIVQVVSNLGGKKVIYNVEVNKVNPNNATQLEMFALLSYTDKMGITDGGTFGSHQQLEVYGGNASRIGYCGSLSGADVFLNETFDWTSIMEKMVQVYKDAGIENQAEDCKALFDFFATYTENDEVKDNTAIDFSRFAPNAPEEVKQAFMEAAEETGYNEGERMDYLSQVFIHQVENRQNGAANYTDVFGSSVASALQAAREILYDLENPLMPDNQRSEEVIKYREQEKEFYRAFITKLEEMSDTGNVLFSKEQMESPFLEDSISVQYAAASTKENPVVEVSMQIGGETITQEINISEVNPRKATQLEMYAFFYHQDMVTGEQNTYQKFTSYVENAVQNGHFEGNQNYSDFTEKEHDWQKVIISMWEDYSDAGIYSQMQECIKLNEAMEKASIQFVDFDNITLVNKSSEVFFTYPGMNVPEQLQVAWMEIAGAMENTERYSHLTQVLNRRIEAELEGKDLQDETGVIDAAIEAVKKALQDLENTPTEIIAKQPDVQEEMQEFKSYYEAFIQKLEALKEGDAETTEVVTEKTTEDITVTYREFFAMYMEQIFIKIQSGDTEPTYQIGSQSFTEKEWETFLEKFDSIEEAIQELMKEEQARKEAEEANQENALAGTVSAGKEITENHGLEKENVSAIDDGALLTAETTSCKYETADPDDDDIVYVTFYTTDGIWCKKLGAEDFEWTLTFENEEQYNKVMEFIGQFPSDWNMRFAAHENFWNDFLNDEIDMEGFMEFINGTNKGVPDYSVTVGDSMYIDTDKMQWAKYTNPLGARFYTAEEMHQMQVEIIAANEAKLTKFTDWDAYEEMYKKNHPEYNGEKICCEYPGGPLYTVKEMAELQYRKMLERMGTTEEREQQKRDEWRKQMGYPGY